MQAKQIIAWMKKCGIAVESARASVPSLAHLVAGEPIRGSWWAHPKGNDILWLSRVIRRSPDVLVCRLVDGKITYVHRRMWPTDPTGFEDIAKGGGWSPGHGVFVDHSQDQGR